MKKPIRTRTFGWVLAVAVVIPLAAATETGTPEPGANSTAAVEDGRVDEMSAWSVDSGGGESSGGDFSLIAAIGQPDAGVLSGGGAVLAGGVWAGEMNLGFVFGDGFESGDTGSWSSVVGGNP